jgi:hypothetical protein
MASCVRMVVGIAVICGLGAFSPEANAQAAKPEESIDDVQPVKIAQSDSPLRKLLKERFNTAVEEVRAANALYGSGKTTLDAVLEAMGRFAKAGVELAQTPAERVRYRELTLTSAQTMEAMVQDRFQEGGASLDAMLRAKGVRLDAEIALLREREAK